MFNAVVEQMKMVEATIDKMSLRAGFGFALSCTERQWPVFERALNYKLGNMTRQDVFRNAVDSAWEFCLHETPVPSDLVAECRREVPDSVGDTVTAVVHTISNSIVDLLSAIQRNDRAYPHHLSGRNLGLIEMLLDEHGLLLDSFPQNGAQDSAEVKRIRGLVIEEIQHQNEDLKKLSADASISAISATRNGSLGKSLFNGLWFS